MKKKEKQLTFQVHSDLTQEDLEALHPEANKICDRLLPWIQHNAKGHVELASMVCHMMAKYLANIKCPQCEEMKNHEGCDHVKN